MNMRGLGMGGVVLAALFAMVTVLSSCGGDDDDNGASGGSSTIGTFAGNIQVSDDPTTDVGYLYNVKVTVTRNGSNATVKIVGDPGFSREYTGTITSQGAIHHVVIAKQTKPSEKTAGEAVVISDNKLTVTIDIANDAVSVYDNPSSTSSFQITGKLQMIGTDLLRE